MITFGRPSRSPDFASLDGRTKRSASRRRATISGCALEPRNATLLAMPASCACFLRLLSNSPPPTWTKRQCRSWRQGGERLDQVAIALLRHGAADGDDAHGIERVRAVARRAAFGRRGKPRQIEPVIDERHLLRPAKAIADVRRPAPCRSRPRALRPSSRASPNPASSRCPWHGPRRSRSGRSAGRHSARRRRACAGNARADAARPPAARVPWRRPGRGGARGWR